MTNKKPFTEEQEERIREIAGIKVDLHETHSPEHKWSWIYGVSIFILSVVFAFNAISYSQSQPLTPDNIGEMLGWEKVCVEWKFDWSNIEDFNPSVIRCIPEWNESLSHCYFDSSYPECLPLPCKNGTRETGVSFTIWNEEHTQGHHQFYTDDEWWDFYEKNQICTPDGYTWLPPEGEEVKP